MGELLPYVTIAFDSTLTSQRGRQQSESFFLRASHSAWGRAQVEGGVCAQLDAESASDAYAVTLGIFITMIVFLTFLSPLSHL